MTEAGTSDSRIPFKRNWIRLWVFIYFFKWMGPLFCPAAEFDCQLRPNVCGSRGDGTSGLPSVTARHLPFAHRHLHRFPFGLYFPSLLLFSYIYRPTIAFEHLPSTFLPTVTLFPFLSLLSSGCRQKGPNCFHFYCLADRGLFFHGIAWIAINFVYWHTLLHNIIE